MFAQGDTAVLTCRDCGEQGHVQRNCPHHQNSHFPGATSADTNTDNPPEHLHAMVAKANSVPLDSDLLDDKVVFAQKTSVVGTDTILLDNQSTINQFSSANLLTDICPSSHPVRVHCNAGTMLTIVNVLSLSWDRNRVFVVHTPLGPLEFHPTTRGLHSLDLNTTPGVTVAAMLVNTVPDNYKGFMKRQAVKAHEARCMQRMLGCQSDQDFQGMVHEKLITTSWSITLQSRPPKSLRNLLKRKIMCSALLLVLSGSALDVPL